MPQLNINISATNFLRRNRLKYVVAKFMALDAA